MNEIQLLVGAVTGNVAGVMTNDRKAGDRLRTVFNVTKKNVQSQATIDFLLKKLYNNKPNLLEKAWVDDPEFADVIALSKTIADMLKEKPELTLTINGFDSDSFECMTQNY